MSAAKVNIEFLIDTSVLVNIRDEHDDSVTIWRKVISAIEHGRVKTIRHVWDELESRFPDIAKRLKNCKKQFLIPDDILYSAGAVAEVRYLNEHHRVLWNPTAGRNPADPMLIGVAKELHVIVVTDEKRTGHHHKKKIPYVCRQRNIGCTDRIEFLRKIGCDV